MGLIPDDLLDAYEFHDYAHALEILVHAFPEEAADLFEALRTFEIDIDEIIAAGGNESAMPKKFDDVLYPRGWREIRITGDLVVKQFPRQVAQRRGKFSNEPNETKVIKGFIDGHNIDFVKNRVAFDLEWNSKDQTFDRDLLAMRTFFDCGVIDVGVIVTRSAELNDIFAPLGLKAKYGASTTWMGKLIPRLDSRRNGGCPILAVGIKKRCVVEHERRVRDYASKLADLREGEDI